MVLVEVGESIVHKDRWSHGFWNLEEEGANRRPIFGIVPSLPGGRLRRLRLECCRDSVGNICLGIIWGRVDTVGVVDRNFLDLEYVNKVVRMGQRSRSARDYTYQRACPEEDPTDGSKDNANDEKQREDTFRGQDRSSQVVSPEGGQSVSAKETSSLPGFQSLLPKSSI